MLQVFDFISQIFDVVLAFLVIGLVVFVVIYSLSDYSNEGVEISKEIQPKPSTQPSEKEVSFTQIDNEKALIKNTLQENLMLKKRNQYLEQTLIKAQKEKIEQEEKQRKVVLEELAKAESKYKKIWSFDRGE